MSHFIPVSNEKAQDLESRLSQQIFRSVKDFVEFYNSGLISKKHEDVKEITREITETFKDVKEKNGRLVFISEEEVALEETLENLKIWESLIKAKREVKDAVENNLVRREAQLLLDENGMLNIIEEDDETGDITLTAISNEKVVSRKDEVEAVAKKIDENATHSSTMPGYLVPVERMFSMDTEFILEVKELIPSN